MRKVLIVLLSVCTISSAAGAVSLGPGPSSDILTAIETVAARFYAGKTLRQITPQMVCESSQSGLPACSPDPQRVGFNLCGVYASKMGLDSEHLEGVADIAAFVVLMRAELNSAQLRAAAESYLKRLEAIAVDRLDAVRGLQHKLNEDDYYDTKVRTQESLAAALNKVVVANSMGPGARYELQECGGGEIHVRLVTRPAEAKVYVIKLFDYTLCDVRHIDPSDKEHCFGWMPNAADVLDMSGWYEYQAIWPDGKITGGRFSVTEKLFIANVDDDKPLVLTLSR
jgi:hypothetical protein